MLRFLPKEERIQITKIYNDRRIFVCVAGLALIALIALVELVPAYVLSRAKIDTIVGGNGTSTPGALLVQTARDVEILKKVTSVPSPIPFQKRLLAVKRNDIEINSFSWKIDGGAEQIQISGTAGHRESLVAFVKNLQKDGAFSGIDLPVSFLVKEKDIDFSLSGTYTQK